MIHHTHNSKSYLFTSIKPNLIIKTDIINELPRLRGGTIAKLLDCPTVIAQDPGTLDSGGLHQLFSCVLQTKQNKQHDYKEHTLKDVEISW